jgi:hypothetical protein
VSRLGDINDYELIVRDQVHAIPHTLVEPGIDETWQGGPLNWPQIAVM